MHLPDAGGTDNAMGLSADELKKRKVELIDITVAAHDTHDKDYQASYVVHVWLRHADRAAQYPSFCLHLAGTIQCCSRARLLAGAP